VELLDFDPAKLAEEMYFVNIATYRGQKIFEELNRYCSPVRFVPGEADINEYIEFRSKPSLYIIHQLQIYFGNLAKTAFKNLEDKPGSDFKFNATLNIYGNINRVTSNIYEFVYYLNKELPYADHFSFVSSYSGPRFAGQVDDEIDVPLYEMINFEECEKACDISYASFEFLYNHGEGGCTKYVDGEWKELELTTSDEILDKEFSENWWCWNQDLYFKFDFDKYPEILEAVQDTVKRYIPESELQYCQNAWEDEGPEFLIRSISWFPRKLRELQNFLDELNVIIAPIKHECECYCIGDWWIPHFPFAMAKWDWFEDGFYVRGTELV